MHGGPVTDAAGIDALQAMRVRFFGKIPPKDREEYLRLWEALYNARSLLPKHSSDITIQQAEEALGG